MWIEETNDKTLVMTYLRLVYSCLSNSCICPYPSSSSSSVDFFMAVVTCCIIAICLLDYPLPHLFQHCSGMCEKVQDVKYVKNH